MPRFLSRATNVNATSVGTNGPQRARLRRTLASAQLASISTHHIVKRCGVSVKDGTEVIPVLRGNARQPHCLCASLSPAKPKAKAAPCDTPTWTTACLHRMSPAAARAPKAAVPSSWSSREVVTDTKTSTDTPNASGATSRCKVLGHYGARPETPEHDSQPTPANATQSSPTRHHGSSGTRKQASASRRQNEIRKRPLRAPEREAARGWECAMRAVAPQGPR